MCPALTFLLPTHTLNHTHTHTHIFNHHSHVTQLQNPSNYAWQVLITTYPYPKLTYPTLGEKLRNIFLAARAFVEEKEEEDRKSEGLSSRLRDFLDTRNSRRDQRSELPQDLRQDLPLSTEFDSNELKIIQALVARQNDGLMKSDSMVCECCRLRGLDSSICECCRLRRLDKLNRLKDA